MKKIILITIISLLLSNCAFASIFTDLPENHWAYSEIMNMKNLGAIKGLPDGRFNPSGYITRSEFSTMLVNTYKLASTSEKAKNCGFDNANLYINDVPQSHWAYDNILLCVKNGYILPYENHTFVPSEPMLREDAAFALAVLYFYDPKYLGEDADITPLSIFKDAGEFDPDLKGMVSVAVKNNLMVGANGFFRPESPLTRAEVCSLLYRAYTTYGLPVDSIGYEFTELNSKPETSENKEQKPEPFQAPDTQNVTSQIEKRVFDLTNEARIAEGLSPLLWSDELANVARAHSKDMHDRDYFNHTNPEGLSPFDRMNNAGITFSHAAENIIAGYNTAEDIVKGWLDSPGHRANILNPELEYLGVGIFQGTNGYGIYGTQCFATLY